MVKRGRDAENRDLSSHQGNLWSIDGLDQVADVGEKLRLPQNVATEPRKMLPVPRLHSIARIVEGHVADVVKPCSCGDSSCRVVGEAEPACEGNGVRRGPLTVAERGHA